jgi:hypothetical protein
MMSIKPLSPKGGNGEDLRRVEMEKNFAKIEKIMNLCMAPQELKVGRNNNACFSSSCRDDRCLVQNIVSKT